MFEYLRALEGQNPRQLADLLVAATDRDRDLVDRLRRFGGARAESADVQIASDSSSGDLSVTIHTVGEAGQVLAWSEQLVWRDGRWQLPSGGAHPLDGEERPAP